MTIAEAEEQIGSLVRFIAERRATDEGEAPPFVTGWLVSYEAQSTEDLANEVYGGGTIAPDNQSPALCRGLAGGASDFYRASPR